MIKRSILAVLLTAALVLQSAGGAWANPEQKKQDDRDTQSRNELAALGILPLVLANNAQLRVATIVFMMQNLLYTWQLQQIKVINENRISVGGLLGGLLPTTYTAKDFVKSLEVGSVYWDGSAMVVAMKGERRLKDYNVAVFNGNYQYIPQGYTEANYVDAGKLAVLGAIPILNRMMLGQASALDVAVATAPEDAQSLHDLGVDMLEQIPQIRERMIGKIYKASDNTLLILIQPSIVQDR